MIFEAISIVEITLVLLQGSAIVVETSSLRGLGEFPLTGHTARHCLEELLPSQLDQMSSNILQLTEAVISLLIQRLHLSNRNCAL